MPRKSKVVNNLAHQAEIMNSEVRKDGVGEHPLIQAVVSDKFAEATNKEAIEIALLLQQLVRGQNSMLSKQDELSDELNRLRGRMDGYDMASEAWNKDRAGFLAKIDERAEELRIDDPAKRAALMASEAGKVQQQIQWQRANMTVDRMKFKDLLDKEPQEMVIAPGKITTVNEGGVIRQKLEAEVIKIKHLTWILQPNVPTLVPRTVANEYRGRVKTRNENNERKALLNATAPKDNVVVAQEWGKLNQKYQSSGDAFIADSR